MDQISVRPVLTMTPTHGLNGFRFIDCVANVVMEEYDKHHPDGYSAKPDGLSKQVSQVSAMVGAKTEVSIYPEQFGIPCEKGTVFYFIATPADFVDACVAAIREELFPDDYVI